MKVNRVIETFFVEGNAVPIYKLENGVFLYPFAGRDKIVRYFTKDRIQDQFESYDNLSIPYSVEERDKFDVLFSIFE